MPNRPQSWAAGRARRWLGIAFYLAALGIVVMVIPRLGSRSPVAIVLLCALAILTMKLVERRVRQWFQRWAERQAARTRPPHGPS
jgi:peptidoglycan/LPS O-acetylase OafA/YrhL